MEQENKTTTTRTRKSKRLLILLFSLVILVCFATITYFSYKFFCPTNKELFVIANVNTIKTLKNTEEPEQFTKTTNISFSTEGDFSSKKTADILSSFSLILENTKVKDDETEFNLSANILGNEILKTNAIKIGETEVLTIPQLSDTSYGADSYKDIISVLLGSDDAENIQMFEEIDTKALSKYFKKYLTEIYKNVPERVFKLEKNGDIKRITFDIEIDRVLYSTLVKVKADNEFRELLYEETKKVCENINKNYPYAGDILKAPAKEEFCQKYEKCIDDFIKNNENSKLFVTSVIDKNRCIAEENIKIVNGDEERYNISYSGKEFNYIVKNNNKILLKLSYFSEKSGSVTQNKTALTFDINNFTKDKSDGQKMVTMSLDSKMNAAIVKTLAFPENYIDLRMIQDEEKEKITQEASENFVGFITMVILELF